ncbi:UNVERIFIED_CONTAM: hypothetical protein Sangu_2404400 [Sesamum angustifolium]|uniref:Uncharacterized protein n=1 Tax=Sesamum angustifolium TaxID=2727405 RepID=A0AAW2KWW9_9LAMI
MVSIPPTISIGQHKFLDNKRSTGMMMNDSMNSNLGRASQSVQSSFIIIPSTAYPWWLTTCSDKAGRCRIYYWNDVEGNDNSASTKRFLSEKNGRGHQNDSQQPTTPGSCSNQTCGKP